MGAGADAPVEAERDVAAAQSPDAGQPLFRTIGEAAAELGLKPHVLRFWETKFAQIKPMKRADGRRYYRAEDVERLRLVQHMLHVEGLTIRGAQLAFRQRLREAAAPRPTQGAESVSVEGPLAAGRSVKGLQEAVRAAVERGDFVSGAVEGNELARRRLEGLLSDLTGLKSRVDLVRKSA
ncbi:MerR family transcriptional regulator [bacterium]|nr:MerR family transcriptional regulator [bacterium]